MRGLDNAHIARPWVHLRHDSLTEKTGDITVPIQAMENTSPALHTRTHRRFKQSESVAGTTGTVCRSCGVNWFLPARCSRRRETTRVPPTPTRGTPGRGTPAETSAVAMTTGRSCLHRLLRPFLRHLLLLLVVWAEMFAKRTARQRIRAANERIPKIERKGQSHLSPENWKREAKSLVALSGHTAIQVPGGSRSVADMAGVGAQHVLCEAYEDAARRKQSRTEDEKCLNLAGLQGKSILGTPLPYELEPHPRSSP